MRRAIVLLVLAVLAAGATAVAQDDGSGEAPVVRSGDVLHLQDQRACHGGRGVTTRITPPAGLQLGWISVRVDGHQVVRLTGVAGGASVTVRLPRRASRVSAVAETLDGQRLARARQYRSCIPPARTPTPPQPRREGPPVIVGGGEA